MTIKVTENQRFIEERNKLLIEYDDKETTKERKLKIVPQIYAFDEVITKNIEKHLQHIRTEFNELSSYDTSMSKRQRYERMKQVYREAQNIWQEASKFKKMMRETK